MGYIHPGTLFVQKFGLVESSEDVIRYARFLREEAGLGVEPPIDLTRIYTRFDIPTPKRAPLPKQQGLLLNSEKGIILIKADDPATRQRFSEAHELMELLFKALPPSKGWDATAQKIGGFTHNKKEQLCNEGAAELLMPYASFVPQVRQLSVSFQTARQLAPEFDVSMTAVLVHMVRIGSGRHSVVLWKMKNKAAEIQSKISEHQLSLFGDVLEEMPPKKLRVEWSLSGSGIPYIPPDKSVPEDSSIHRAWKDRKFTVGEDRLDLANIWGIFRCESQPFEVDSEWFVISLLHLPGDEGCY